MSSLKKRILKIKWKFAEIVIKIFGNIHFSWYPLFLSFGNTKYWLKGKEQRIVLNLIKPGDIILRRYSGYINNRFIPGFWSHVGIVEDDENIIHATTHGVIREDILTFFRTDFIGLCRIKDLTDFDIHKATEGLRNALGTKYDYYFDTKDSKNLYCSELTWLVWNNKLGEWKGGVIPPSALMDNPNVEIIHDSRTWRKEHGNI
jgi:hypothetical protein